MCVFCKLMNVLKAGGVLSPLSKCLFLVLKRRNGNSVSSDSADCEENLSKSSLVTTILQQNPNSIYLSDVIRYISLSNIFSCLLGSVDPDRTFSARARFRRRVEYEPKISNVWWTLRHAFIYFFSMQRAIYPITVLDFVRYLDSNPLGTKICVKSDTCNTWK